MFYGSYSWHILVVWIVRRLAKMFLAINNKHFFFWQIFGLFCDLEFGDQVVIFTKSNKATERKSSPV